MEAKVADWLEKLKDVSYEMDDVLDEWNTELLKQQVKEEVDTKKKVCFLMPSSCFCFGQVDKVIHNRTLAKKIKELNEKLTSIAADRELYGFRHSAIVGPDDQQLIQRQKTSSLVDISKIFGRDEEKEMLLSKLLRENNQDGGRFLVIPIVGMGGMGKTTFAQLAFNNEKVRAHFDKKVWVCVSDPFDEIRIAKAIIESLGGVQSSSNELETLLLCIRSKVEHKKFLLVLDDVWTEDQRKWENLKLPEIMQSSAEGSTILVTTRKQGVAKMMRATNSIVHLDKLSDRDSLALFKSIAFSDREEGETIGLEAISEDLVKKCKGLPLAIKTLGSLLWFKKTIGEWQGVLNSEIWELEEFEEKVFQPLLLSYYDLTPTARRCLLYCAIFPKDYELRKDNLIELWMSQDYLSLRGKKEKRSVGENYFESLALRSFFQDFKRVEMRYAYDCSYQNDVYSCKMHDIVHDFVQFLSKRECITMGGNRRMEKGNDKVRHLSLTNVRGSLSFHASFYNCKHMRTLTVLDSRISTIDSSTILQVKCLRTINLKGSSLEKLPKEIGELIHLRYLDLSDSQYLRVLPEAVCDCINVQTLDLRLCSKLEILPQAMGKLINLKHLYVMGCTELRYLPKGIGSLKSLQALDWVDTYGREHGEALKLGDLGIMELLQGSLKIAGLGNKDDDASEVEKAQLGNKEHLSELVAIFKRDEYGYQRILDSEILKAMQPHPNLESLSIMNCQIGTTDSLDWINSLHNLRLVDLRGWKFCEVLPPLGKLLSLEVLKIGEMSKVKNVGVEFLGSQEGILFPKLKRLSFSGLYKWEEWEGIAKVDSSEITIMPRLSELEIDCCPKLKALPDFLYKITALHTLTILFSPILEREYKNEVGKEWHNISHIPNLIIR